MFDELLKYVFTSLLCVIYQFVDVPVRQDLDLIIVCVFIKNFFCHVLTSLPEEFILVLNDLVVFCGLQGVSVGVKFFGCLDQKDFITSCC